MLKLILSELRFTIRSFNNLTHIYKQVNRQLNPADDLKVFNEFFNFRTFKGISEVADEVSDVESDEEEIVDTDDEDSDESGLEDNNNSEDDTDRDSMMSPESSSKKSQNEEDSESSKSDLVSIQSTLRRFNSTPEIPIDLGNKEKNVSTSLNSKTAKIKSNSKKSFYNKNDNDMNIEKNKLIKPKSQTQVQGNKDELSDEDDDDDDDDIESDLNHVRGLKGKTFLNDRAW